MSEMNSSFGFNKLDASQLELNGYCGELLNHIIPKLLSRSYQAQRGILHSRDVGGIDATFLSYDYLVDGLASYRLRMVPRPLEEDRPQFRTFGKVRQMIVNVPVAFVKDPARIEGIELAMITLDLDTPQTTITQRYVVAPTTVKPITDFSKLEFDFKSDDVTGEVWVDGVSVVHDGLFTESDFFTEEGSVEHQLQNVREIFRLMDLMMIGHQSVNDGTA